MYNFAIDVDSGHYATLTHVDNSDGFMRSESSLVGAPSARGIGLPSGLRPIAILSGNIFFKQQLRT